MDVVETPVWQLLLAVHTLDLVEVRVRTDLSPRELIAPDVAGNLSRYLHHVYQVVGVDDHVLVALLLVHEELAAIWEILRVQYVPVDLLSVVSDADVQTCLIVPLEVLLVVQYRQPQQLCGVVVLDKDEPSTDVAEEVFQNRVHKPHARAVHLKHNVSLLRHTVQVLQRVLEEGDVGVCQQNSLSTRQKFEKNSCSLDDQLLIGLLAELCTLNVECRMLVARCVREIVTDLLLESHEVELISEANLPGRADPVPGQSHPGQVDKGHNDDLSLGRWGVKVAGEVIPKGGQLGFIDGAVRIAPHCLGVHVSPQAGRRQEVPDKVVGSKDGKENEDELDHSLSGEVVAEFPPPIDWSPAGTRASTFVLPKVYTV